MRVTGSGDACPDWPTCYGRWIPPITYHALLEWGHRTTGVLVGILIIAAFGRTLIRHRAHAQLAWLTFGGVALVAVVGLIGGRVVLSGLDPGLRTAHLALAEIALLVMVVALVVAAAPPGAWRLTLGAERKARATSRLAAIAAAAMLIALLSGSYAVWRGAGVVCPSWPLCSDGAAIQSELEWIQMAHRVLAAAGVVLAAWAAHRAFRLTDASRAVRVAALGAIAIATVQVLIGAANPWTAFSQWARAAHLGFATLLWADTALLAVLIWQRLRRATIRGGPATIE